MIFCTSIKFIDFIIKKIPIEYIKYKKEYLSTIYKSTYISRYNSQIINNNNSSYSYISDKEMMILHFNFLVKLLKQLEILYNIGNISFALLAFGIHYFFFAFHLIDFIRSQPLMINVLMSVYKCRMQLLVVLIFLLIATYFYSLVIYYFFYHEIRAHACNSVLACIVVVFTSMVSNILFIV